MTLHTYLARRLIFAVPLLIGITMISFLIIYMAPGDPVLRFVSPDTSPADLERMRHALGLDRPLPVQYARWLGNLLTGDWGKSFADGQPVLQKIMERLPATLELALAALLLEVLIAIPVGVIAATRQYSLFDYISTVFAFIGVSIPNFWFGLMLMLLFSVHLGWLPSIGRLPTTGEVTLWIRIKHLIMPSLVLALTGIATYTRFMRSSMLEVVRQDFIRTARSKGLPERVVVYKHAMRNALIPIVTLLGLALPGLVSGAAITESLFAWPGLGRLFVQSAFNRDYTVTMGGLLIASTMVVLGNLLADILYAAVDPRIKYS